MSENEEKKDVVDKVADGVKEATDDVKEFAGDAKEVVTETANEVIDTAKNLMNEGDIPEAKKSLVMGIVGLVCAAVFVAAPLGIVFGIIGMKRAKIALGKVDQDPQKFKKEKVKATIGKFTGLGGVILGAIYTVMLVISLVGAIANA